MTVGVAPEVRMEPRRVAPVRVAQALVLSAWAGLFWFLFVSGRSWLYVGARTAWVVPAGAVVLSFVALGRWLSVRAARPDPVTPARAWALGLIALPVVVVLAFPPSALGSYAAGRRSAALGFAGTGDVSEGEITLVDLGAALWSEETAAALAARAGSDVSFVGFVTRREGMPADEFLLTRFIVSCCVADALSVQVRVVNAPAGRFEQDQWVSVDGTFYPLGDEMVVDADRVRAVERPERPYLNV